VVVNYFTVVMGSFGTRCRNMHRYYCDYAPLCKFSPLRLQFALKYRRSVAFPVQAPHWRRPSLSSSITSCYSSNFLPSFGW